MIEYCEAHLERTGNQVPAVKNVAGTPYCQPCFDGAPIRESELENIDYQSPGLTAGQIAPIVGKKQPKKRGYFDTEDEADIAHPEPVDDPKPIQAKELMRDGKWLVPEGERPALTAPIGEVLNSKVHVSEFILPAPRRGRPRKQIVTELTETHTHTTTLTAYQGPDITVPAVPEKIEGPVVLVDKECITPPLPALTSFIDPDPPESQYLVEAAVKYHEFPTEDDDAWFAQAEHWADESMRLARQISIHRQAKALTDIALNKWLDTGVRETIEFGKEPPTQDDPESLHLRELWKFVHAEILAVLECYKK